MEFEPFPKIARLNKDVIITEKLDGTNAQIHIEVECGNLWPDYSAEKLKTVTWAGVKADSDDVYIIRAGSRKRWITPADKDGKGSDNFGFAQWVRDNGPQLMNLGPGQHFGEWWGQGIQRGYDMEERRFSLFNVGRWYDGETPLEFITDKMCRAPKCCHVVPVIRTGRLDNAAIVEAMSDLSILGSHATPDMYFNPEGIIVFHTGNGALFKHTFDAQEGKHSVAA